MNKITAPHAKDGDDGQLSQFDPYHGSEVQSTSGDHDLNQDSIRASSLGPRVRSFTTNYAESLERGRGRSGSAGNVGNAGSDNSSKRNSFVDRMAQYKQSIEQTDAKTAKRASVIKEERRLSSANRIENKDQQRRASQLLFEYSMNKSSVQKMTKLIDQVLGIQSQKTNKSTVDINHRNYILKLKQLNIYHEIYVPINPFKRWNQRTNLTNVFLQAITQFYNQRLLDGNESENEVEDSKNNNNKNNNSSNNESRSYPGTPRDSNATVNKWDGSANYYIKNKEDFKKNNVDGNIEYMPMVILRLSGNNLLQQMSKSQYENFEKLILYGIEFTQYLYKIEFNASMINNNLLEKIMSVIHKRGTCIKNTFLSS